MKKPRRKLRGFLLRKWLAKRYFITYQEYKPEESWPMTTLIIDPSRPLPPTYEDNQDALVLGDGDTLILMAGAEIAAHGYKAAGIYAGWGNTLLIDGRVYSHQWAAISGAGTINIGLSATVSGVEGILFGHGTTNVLNNNGRVYGEDAGVFLDGSRNIINNAGEIAGDSGIYQFASSDPDQILTINNTGTIKGTGGIAIHGVVGVDSSNVVTNRGTIEGDVILGGNGWLEPAGPPTHVYDGRGGTISGVVRFASGNDIAYGGDGSETFVLGANTNFVDGGGGIDTLIYNFQATVDLRITSKQQTGTNAWDTIQNIENLNGSWRADRFIGNDSTNVLVGNGGNDTLDGYGGDDLLSGGAGDDLIVGGAGSDTAVFTGKFSDYTITVIAGSGIKITDNRASGDGTDYLGGMEFAFFSDRIYTLPLVSPTGPAIPDTPVIKNLTFKGGSKADRFVGGKGHDLLNGGLGHDRLTGADGQDTFVFNSKLGPKNVDRIVDFRHVDDTIKLSKAIFSKIEKGMLSKGAFWIGAKAHDKSDRIIYDEKTGALFYDADGAGKKYGTVKFAQLNAKTLLKQDDFFIA
jgi:serralysin